MISLPIYQTLILVLLVAGLVPASAFLSQHRPKHWRRLEAWAASGFVMVAAAIYVRSLVLLVTRWPGSPPRGIGDAVFGVVSLVVIDGLFIVQLAAYWRFARRDRAPADSTEV